MWRRLSPDPKQGTTLRLSLRMVIMDRVVSRLMKSGVGYKRVAYPLRNVMTCVNYCYFAPSKKTPQCGTTMPSRNT